MIKIAKIKENDGQSGADIFFLVDEKTFEVTASNGEEVTYGGAPVCAKEAFEILDQWNQWKTLEYLAEYDDEKNEIYEVTTVE